jgi:hypothetical protein
VLGIEIADPNGHRVGGLTASAHRGVTRAVRRARWWAARFTAAGPPRAKRAASAAANRTV